ncbi:hypothetical protein NPIL_635941 [Nephila pilipes]|uniref:Uncharacterized protein n=1 Tax=Nephila pilipes TaxID=299642 RepID=A0A8X6IS92_NEPPI|nr:hypothetical protein NPIL_635941 [Nephila pilipes]
MTIRELYHSIARCVAACIQIRLGFTSSWKRKGLASLEFSTWLLNLEIFKDSRDIFRPISEVFWEKFQTFAQLLENRKK